MNHTLPALTFAATILAAAGCASNQSANHEPMEPTADMAEAPAPSPGKVQFGAEPMVAAGSGVRTVGLFGEIEHLDIQASAADGDLNLSQVTFAAEGADSDPDIDPKGRFMVYSSTMHREQADLYRKDVQGRTVTQLTTDPGEDIMPCVSPDGSRIAFASNRLGNWDIFVMSVDGGQATQISSDPEAELHPSWSPDGSMLVYCKSGAQSQRWELWVTRVDEPSARHFVDYGLFPRWSPDPAVSKILFQRARQRGSRFHGVWTIDFVNGQGLHPTEVASAANAAVMHPTWSPDGRKIAFVTVLDPDTQGDVPTQSDVWVVNVDGTGRSAITSGLHLNLKPVWGPDGKVFFASNRSGVENIWCASTTPAAAPADVHESAKMASVDEHSESENSSAEPH
jgi:TolB protein